MGAFWQDEEKFFLKKYTLQKLHSHGFSFSSKLIKLFFSSVFQHQVLLNKSNKSISIVGNSMTVAWPCLTLQEHKKLSRLKTGTKKVNWIFKPSGWYLIWEWKIVKKWNVVFLFFCKCLFNLVKIRLPS